MTADRPLAERVRHRLDLQGVDAEAADVAAVAGALNADPSDVRDVLDTLAGREPSEDESEDGPEDHVVAETVRGYYQRACPIYEALGTMGAYTTTVLNDYVGWYIKRDETDDDAIAEGFDRRGRQARADIDLGEVLGRVDRARSTDSRPTRPPRRSGESPAGGTTSRRLAQRASWIPRRRTSLRSPSPHTPRSSLPCAGRTSARSGC